MGGLKNEHEQEGNYIRINDQKPLQCTASTGFQILSSELSMPICGQKSSMCCLVLSIWGLVQLTITGALIYIGSPAFVEDIPLSESENWSPQEWATHLHAGFQQSALNCWIAALLYLVTLCFSSHQFWAHQTSSDQFKATQF